jgi:drug/metabolite transporter (DMT)-like permease
MDRRMGAAEWGTLGALSALWGGSFFLAAVAVAEVPPLSLVLGRVGIAAAALLLLTRACGEPLPAGGRLWLAFAVMGVLNNLLPFALIFWAQTRIASGLAAVLNATTPLFAALLAHGLTRDERLTPARLSGVLLGLGGVAVMVGPGVLGAAGASLLAELAVLGAALSYALAGIFGRRFARAGLSPMATAAGQIAASTALLLPVALTVDRPWALPAPSAAALGAVLGLALLCTALAYVLYFRLLARAGATNLLLVTLLIPVSAILLGTLFLGERLETRQIAGMALIAAGLAAIDGRALAPLRRAAARQSPARKWVMRQAPPRRSNRAR